MAEITFLEGLRQGLREEMERDDRVFILDHQHRAPLKIHCLIVGRGKLQTVTPIRRRSRDERFSPRLGELRG